MWNSYVRLFNDIIWSSFDRFYGVTPGYHKQNQKKLRRMRRQGCKI